MLNALGISKELTRVEVLWIYKHRMMEVNSNEVEYLQILLITLVIRELKIERVEGGWGLKLFQISHVQIFQSAGDRRATRDGRSAEPKVRRNFLGLAPRNIIL